MTNVGTLRNCDAKFDISMLSRMRRSNILITNFTVENFSNQPTPGLDPSRSWCVATGLVPDRITIAAASSQRADTGYPEFHIPEGKKGTSMVVLVRSVPNPTDDGPRYKIARELAKLPLPMTDIVKMSAAMKQLCVYLKHDDLQEQNRLACGDFLEIFGWVPYWIQSGISPLILLAVVVFTSHREDPTLADPNFYNTVTDGLMEHGRRYRAVRKVRTICFGWTRC